MLNFVPNLFEWDQVDLKLRRLYMRSLLEKKKMRALLVFVHSKNNNSCIPLFQQVGFSVLFELSEKDVHTYLTYCSYEPFVRLFAETKIDFEGDEGDHAKELAARWLVTG